MQGCSRIGNGVYKPFDMTLDWAFFQTIHLSQNVCT